MPQSYRGITQRFEGRALESRRQLDFAARLVANAEPRDVAGHIARLGDVIVHDPHFDCLTAKTLGEFGLAFLLSAVFGHNSDLEFVGQADHPFHQTAAKNHRPSLLLGPGKEDLCNFMEAGKVDQSLGHIFAL